MNFLRNSFFIVFMLVLLVSCGADKKPSNAIQNESIKIADSSVDKSIKKPLQEKKVTSKSKPSAKSLKATEKNIKQAQSEKTVLSSTSQVKSQNKPAKTEPTAKSNIINNNKKAGNKVGVVEERKDNEKKAKANEDSFAVSMIEKPCNRLFHIAKSSNKNILYYDVNFKDKLINPDNPFDIYWLMFEKKGQREEMNSIEKGQLGVNVREIVKGKKYIMNMKSSDLAYIDITVDIDRNGCGIATTTLEGQQAQITDIFAGMKSSFIPSIDYIDINGITKDGKKVTDRIKPK